MARRNKQYRRRMTDLEFEKLEKLSRETGFSKAATIRHALKNYEMMAHYIINDRKAIEGAIEEAYRGGFTHAVYTDTDGIKSTKPNIEPIGGAKN